VPSQDAQDICKIRDAIDHEKHFRKEQSTSSQSFIPEAFTNQKQDRPDNQKSTGNNHRDGHKRGQFSVSAAGYCLFAHRQNR
jgi:hypothetical protein